jgi:hypothetical protein
MGGVSLQNPMAGISVIMGTDDHDPPECRIMIHQIG